MASTDILIPKTLFIEHITLPSKRPFLNLAKFYTYTNNLLSPFLSK